MVKLISLFMLFVVATCAHASSTLTLTASKNTVEIGKPLLVMIIATDIKEKLSSINLGGLERDFGVVVKENAIKSDKTSIIQSLKIALYPRRVGKIILPQLELSQYKTEEITVTIKPAETIIGDILFSSSLSSNNVWQRQQIILSITIITPSKFSIIELEGIENKALEATIINTVTKELAGGLYEHSAGWKLYPLFSGDLKLNLPAINYKLNGVIQRKFFPVHKSIYVKALPTYIPPLMPVGTLKIINTVEITDSDDYSHLWEIQFITDNIMPSSLSSLTMPLGNMRNLKHGEIEQSALTSGSKITLPITFINNGFFTFPETTYKIFNTNSGKITSVTTPSISMFILNIWVKYIIFILFLLVSIFLCYLSFKYVRTIYIRHKEKQEIIQSSLTAETPSQLHCILNRYAENQGWGDNMTLEQWLCKWKKHSSRTAYNTIGDLSLACYKGEYESISQESLNRQIHKLLTN